jgi:ADP-ribosylglycohydrolase
LALTLARSIVAQGGYDRETVARAYVAWYRSQPFDVGNATRQALGAATDDDIHTGQTATALQRAASQTSQANGSLMRISPLGIWGYRLPADQLAEYARADSALTHPDPVCQEACAVFAVAVAQAIATGLDIKSLYEHTMRWAERACRSEIVIEVLQQAAQRPPADYSTRQGWVLIALQNAFYQLLHAPNLEEGVVRTVTAGGDTDTNAAIAGALLGAAYGREAIPLQWRQMVLTCRPLDGSRGVHRPRPRAFWPVDALELGERLLLASGMASTSDQELMSGRV